MMYINHPENGPTTGPNSSGTSCARRVRYGDIIVCLPTCVPDGVEETLIAMGPVAAPAAKEGPRTTEEGGDWAGLLACAM